MDFTGIDAWLRAILFAGVAVATLWLAGWAAMGGSTSAARQVCAALGGLATIPAALAAPIDAGMLLSALALLAIGGFVVAAATTVWELLTIRRATAPELGPPPPAPATRAAGETRVASYASLTVASPSRPDAETEALAALPQQLGYLVEYSAGGRPARLGPETTIGRDPQSGVVADSPEVSREHAVVRAEDGRFVLYDMGGRNGTSLRRNGRRRRITSPTPLNDLDVIEIGPVRLVFLEAERKD